MKMLVTSAAVVVVSAVAVMHAIAANGPDRPPGLTASQWAPVSDSLGVVLVAETFMPADPAAPLPADAAGSGHLPRIQPLDGSVLASPANGYFMVKRGGRWVRLVVIEPLKGPGDAG